MADETVDIDVNVNVNTEESEGKFVRLQTQIKQTRIALQEAEAAGDSVKFANLKNQLDDLEDRLEANQIKSKQFIDQIAIAPGPLGRAGAAVKGLDDAFKFLLANPVVATIAAIAAALFLMKKSLEQTAEGQEVLNELSATFGQVIKVAAQIVNVVAVPVFKAFGAIIAGVGEAFAFATGKSKEYAEGLESAQLASAIDNLVKKEQAAQDARAYGQSEFYNKANQNIIDYQKANQKVLENEQLSQEQKNKALLDNQRAYTKKKEQIQREEALAEINKLNATKESQLAIQQSADELRTARAKSNAKLTEEELAKIELAAEQRRYAREADRLAREKKAFEFLKNTNTDEYRNLLAEINKNEQSIVEARTAYSEKIREIKRATLEREINDLKDNFAVRQNVEKEFYAQERAVINTSFAEREYDQRGTQGLLLALEKEQNDAKLVETERFINAQKDKLKTARDQNLITQIEYNVQTKDLDQQLFDARSVNLQSSYDRTVEIISLTKQANEEFRLTNIETNKIIGESYIQLGNSIASTLSSIASMLTQGSDAQKTFAIISVLVNAAAAVGDVIMKTQQATIAFAQSAATGKATILSGTALLSNPITAALGAAQIAAGTAAVGGSVAGIAAAKVNKIASIVAIGAGAAAQIAAITSKGKSTSGGSATSGAAAGGGGATVTPAFTSPTIGAPQIGPTGAQEGTIAGIVAGTLAANNSSGRPIRAYVVGNDITSEQQLQRRIKTAARLGG
jgi:hypothetical protein